MLIELNAVGLVFLSVVFIQYSSVFSILILVFAGDPEMLKEKVLSILDHITNNHSFPQNSKHLKCSHGDLGPEELRTRPFISKNSASAKKLEKALKGANNSRYIAK